MTAYEAETTTSCTRSLRGIGCPQADSPHAPPRGQEGDPRRQLPREVAAARLWDRRTGGLRRLVPDPRCAAAGLRPTASSGELAQLRPDRLGPDGHVLVERA